MILSILFAFLMLALISDLSDYSEFSRETRIKKNIYIYIYIKYLERERYRSIDTIYFKILILDSGGWKV